MKPFLTARWSHLLLFTYPVPDASLRPYLPPGIEIEQYQGHAHVSLVAFDFLDTRVRGLRIPGHVRFPEVNLRCYVTRPLPDGSHQRGVVFIRELVPRRCIALIARRLYNEPYDHAPMTSRVTHTPDLLTIEHTFTYAGHTHRCTARAHPNPILEPDDSIAHHFKEHEWGFGTDRRGRLTRYRVQHPTWRIFQPLPPPDDFTLDLDFALLYGPSWAFLNQTPPAHLTIAEGSPITVSPQLEHAE